jgi:hypothetical protein
VSPFVLGPHLLELPNIKLLGLDRIPFVTDTMPLLEIAPSELG